jgi:hypothetical protein
LLMKASDHEIGMKPGREITKAKTIEGPNKQQIA